MVWGRPPIRVLVPLTALLVGLTFYMVEGSSALIIHFVKRAALYPLWGYLQNCFGLVILYPRIEKLFSSRISVIFFCGLIFGFMHLPNLPITVGTLFLGWLFAWLYQRRHSLFIIALCHGFVGAGVD
jgi:membrane protease YdiL (CAAX protease family)